MIKKGSLARCVAEFNEGMKRERMKKYKCFGYIKRCDNFTNNEPDDGGSYYLLIEGKRYCDTCINEACADE